MSVKHARQRGIDPLAEQAVGLLAKAMVTSRDRDALWQRFRDHVVAEAKELEEAPIREALDEMEQRGLKLDAVARVVGERLVDSELADLVVVDERSTVRHAAPTRRLPVQQRGRGPIS
jgi:hypothetical protein